MLGKLEEHFHFWEERLVHNTKLMPKCHNHLLIVLKFLRLARYLDLEFHDLILELTDLLAQLTVLDLGFLELLYNRTSLLERRKVKMTRHTSSNSLLLISVCDGISPSLQLCWTVARI